MYTMKLTDYIQSNRRGRKANALEQRALQDAFLRDALDGYDAVQGNHSKSIHDLEKRLQAKHHKVFTLYPYRWWIGGAAACVVLWLGISSLWNTQLPIHPDTAQQMSRSQPPVPGVIPTVADTDSVKAPTAKLSMVKRKSHKHKKVERNTAAIRIPDPQEPQTVGAAMNLQSDEISLLKPVAEVKVKNVANYTGNTSESTQTVHQTLSGTDPGVSVQKEAIFGANASAVKNVPSLNGTKLIGRIVDESGAPLAGATVRLQNQMYSTVADINGNFQLQTPRNPEDTLIFNYIGYKSRKLALGTDLTMVHLEPYEDMLSEVIVVKDSSKKNPGASTKAKVAFGKAEFETFFYKLCAPDLCNSEKQSITAHFMINTIGRPVDVVIEECSCDDLRTEFFRLLKISPVWTYTDQQIKMKLTVNEK